VQNKKDWFKILTVGKIGAGRAPRCGIDERPKWGRERTDSFCAQGGESGHCRAWTNCYDELCKRYSAGFV